VRLTGRTLLYFGLACVGLGIGAAIFIVPMLEAKAQSRYPITPINPQPVLESYVEGVVSIDARDRRHWVFFDFSRGSVVTDAQLDGRNWDLAFQRYRVETNSGSTNPAGIGGAIRLGKKEPAEAPETGWVVDAWEGYGAQTTSVNPEFSRWYRYSPMASGLVSRGDWYLIRTGDGGYAKLQFISYHCPGSLGGGHGCVTFRYGYRSDFSRELDDE
jgi:hypothetical protein